jgi:hypothetical protein
MQMRDHRDNHNKPALSVSWLVEWSDEMREALDAAESGMYAPHQSEAYRQARWGAKRASDLLGILERVTTGQVRLPPPHCGV